MKQRALLLDCDGVLAEVEDGGHLRAFNQVWAEEGLSWRWSRHDYRAATARTCGGHERLLRLADSPEFRRHYGPIPDAAEWHATTKRWHRRKTELLGDEIEARGVTARPGVRRLATEADAAGWRIAVVSSGARRTVELIATEVLGSLVTDVVIISGDEVSAKKPDPECYRVALDRCSTTADAAIAVEDNANGLSAATGAGVPCLVTVTAASCHQDLAGALAVVDNLGEPGQRPARSMDRGAWSPRGGVVLLEDLVRLADAQLAASPAREAVATR